MRNCLLRDFFSILFALRNHDDEKESTQVRTTDTMWYMPNYRDERIRAADAGAQ